MNPPIVSSATSINIDPDINKLFVENNLMLMSYTIEDGYDGRTRKFIYTLRDPATQGDVIFTCEGIQPMGLDNPLKEAILSSLRQQIFNYRTMRRGMIPVSNVTTTETSIFSIENGPLMYGQFVPAYSCGTINNWPPTKIRSS